MDVYGAREDPIPGVTGAIVAAAVPLPEARRGFEPSWSEAPRRLAALCPPGDLVLTLGAGDITQVGPEVLLLLDAGGPRERRRRPDRAVVPAAPRQRPGPRSSGPIAAAACEALGLRGRARAAPLLLALAVARPPRCWPCAAWP